MTATERIVIDNPLVRTLQAARTEGKRGFVPFLTAGYPSIDATISLALALAEAGADLIEIGIPFSDPLADGPVIQAAGHRALQAGFRVHQLFDIAAAIRSKSEVPLAVMSCINPLLQYGIQAFCQQAASSGLQALILPDLPLEEWELVENEAAQANLSMIPFVAPTTPPARMPRLVERGSGFVYCLSFTGVTGSREAQLAGPQRMMSQLRQYTELPLGLGFGISTPQQAHAASQFADLVIVGSQITRIIDENEAGGQAAQVDAVAAFAREMKQALA